MADDGHLGAVHPQRDPLAGQLEPTLTWAPARPDQAGGADHPLCLYRRAVPGGEGRRPRGASTVGSEAGQLGDTQPGRQGLEPVTVQQDMQAALIDPDSDLASCQGRAEPDLLPADLQVP